MVQRIKTRKEAAFFLIKLAYGLIGFPFLLILGVLALLSLTGAGRTDSDIYILISIIWLAILISVGVFFYNVFRKRRLLKIITNDIKHPDFFMPEPGYGMFHVGDGKYLGIDIQRGTCIASVRARWTWSVWICLTGPTVKWKARCSAFTPKFHSCRGLKSPPPGRSAGLIRWGR